ncbi:MAG: hypothetical protein J6Y32_07385 [Bacteroidales bacterium]|nr:hypothetical protein [Bacteroidales bacterium]
MKVFPQWLIALSASVAFLSGCGWVDEDLSDCGKELDIDCEVKMQTNMQTELSTVLSQIEDQFVKAQLQEWLGDILTENANDVDLSFYDTEGANSRLAHMDVNMGGSQAVYTLTIPARDYLHTCVANVAENDQVALVDAETFHGGRLRQFSEREVEEGLMPTKNILQADSVHSHNTCVYAGRKWIRMQAGESQNIDVKLYPVSSASALVLDYAQAGPIGQVRVIAEGFANAFNVADSIFYFTDPMPVKATFLQAEEGTEDSFVAVHFPSKDGASWHWTVDVPLSDGSVTRSVLTVNEVLAAGQLKVLKAKIYDNGVVATDDPMVGVSVTLQWNEAEEHDIEL